MKSMMNRSTFREIKSSFGRYFAILAIVALGVGFFAGLKVTKEAMVTTTNAYLEELQLFDYRLISTLGFEQKDVEALADNEDVRALQGSISADILYLNEEGEGVLKVHSLTEGINGVVVKAGSMPQKADECVVDSNLFGADSIGEKIVLSPNNDEKDRDMFAYGEYTITGIVDASYYMNFERGTTALGTGKVNGYIYIPVQGFDCDYFTEIFVRFDHEYRIYSSEYKDFIEDKEVSWETYTKERADRRYNELYEEGWGKIKDAKAEISDHRNELDEKLSDAKRELEDAEGEIKDAKDEIEQAQKDLNSNEALINSKQSELDAWRQQLEEQKQGLTAMGITVYPQEITEAEVQLDVSQAQLHEARAKIRKGRDEIAENEGKIKESEAEILDGWEEYETSKAEAEEKLLEAEEELADAEEELNDLKEPDTYVLGRETNVGYACFENDSDIVEGVANVFPLFFFLVAALVCVTTMNRMVEEQRTQIGVLKALGYGETAIMNKYMIYSGSAAVIGCIGGFMGGTYLFPIVIYTAYGIMYNFPSIMYVFDVKLAIISIIVSLLCSIGTTWFSCRHELAEAAAGLMRPKAPKAGRRVFLEYVPFIWKRLKFLHKVTVRNIIRYKRRFFMMVVGISGCTALLVTGFGIKDSVANIADKQFDEIQIYDVSVHFKDLVSTDELEEFAQAAEDEAADYAYAGETTVDFEKDGKVKSANLVFMKDSDRALAFINLHKTDGELIPYPANGEAVITKKLADIFQISIGDTVIVRDDSLKEVSVKVGGISENYIDNFIYMSGEYYRELWRKEPIYNTVYIHLDDEKDMHQTAAIFMKLSGVAAVTVNADTKARFDSMMQSLDYVVLLVILCAAFLAFIVLYNLTNINITERIREIATIKVLGFYRMETASYVFRENIVLTAVGTIVGLILGKLLHWYVIHEINIDLVSFDIRVKPLSYALGLLLTFGFAVIVNLVMSVKLERINMAESLKSVD